MPCSTGSAVRFGACRPRSRRRRSWGDFMRPVLTALEMRAVDAQLIEAGVPGIVLMENAGRGAAHLIGLRDRPRALSEGPLPARTRAVGGSCVRWADERALGGGSVAVVCGPGNNGGDGSVVARHLLARGADVEIFLAQDESRIAGDARTALAAFRAVGGRVHASGVVEQNERPLAAFGLVVDAVLGTGTSRAPTGDVLAAIEAINACGRPVVALDVPSGLDATTGAQLGACVRAEHTVTFGFLKTGLLTTSGYSAGGRVTSSHLGVPARLPDGVTPSAFLLEESDVRAQLAPRDPSLHKVQAGRVVVVGPGLGRSDAARERVQAVLALGRPTVLDADGLRAVEGNLGALAAHPALVLTPHSGEAAGLLGITAAEVEQDRFSAVRRLAAATGAIALLKGPRTLIAEPNGRVLVSAFGTPALATAGSGDVLAGIVAGLAASGRTAPVSQRLLEATWLGAALHGLAAEQWSETGGDTGLLATDLIDGLPAVRA